MNNKLILVLIFSITSCLSFGFDNFGNSCKSFYNFNLVQEIKSNHLEELVIPYPNGRFKVISINDGAFTVTEYDNIQAVLRDYQWLPMENRQLLTAMKNGRLDAFFHAWTKIGQLAEKTNSVMSYRIKDMESLKRKIVARVQLFSSQGRRYQISDLSDLIGFRLIVDRNSELLSLTTKNDWARSLNINTDQVLDIEIKGASNDFKIGENKNLYKAIHLSIQLDQGIFEIQVVSKAMSIWHKWDHNHVYKSLSVPRAKLDQFRDYSQYWALLIHLRETKSVESITELLLIYSSLFHLPHFTSFRELNDHLLKKLDMSSDEGFNDIELKDLERSLS